MDIKTIGIDIGKNRFHLYGVNEKGKVMLRKQMTRQKLYEFMTNLKPCLVGMEACGGAHHLARMFKGFGHDVRLMAIQHVKPYTNAYKNDFNDAAGICEAVTRPHMKFVGIKTTRQQDLMAIHNDRARLVQERTALANEIRGLLLENWDYDFSRYSAPYSPCHRTFRSRSSRNLSRFKSVTDRYDRRF